MSRSKVFFYLSSFLPTSIVALLRAQSFKLAAHCFSKALDINSNCASYWANLGVAYLQQGLTPPANHSFSQAQAYDPGLVQGWLGQALVAESMKHHETLDLFRHALELEAHPLACLGFAEQAALATTPMNPAQSHAERLHQSWTPVTNCFVPSGYEAQYTNQALLAAVRLGATAWGHSDARCHYLAGIFLERLGMPGAALQRYSRAAQLLQEQCPDDTEKQKLVAMALGRVQASSGQVSEAVPVLAGAVQQDSPDDYLTLARALFLSNQLTLAEEVRGCEPELKKERKRKEKKRRQVIEAVRRLDTADH